MCVCVANEGEGAKGGGGDDGGSGNVVVSEVVVG